MSTMARLARLLSSAVALRLVVETGAQTCSAPLKTATSLGCSAFCDDDELCIVYDTSAATGNATTDPCSVAARDCQVDANSTCEYLCLPRPPLTSFALLVEFGSYQSDEEKALRVSYGDEQIDSAVDLLQDDTSTYASVNNDALQAIGALNLSSNFTQFQISGGASYYDYVDGKVALVEFGDELIASQTQIERVRLLNLDLSAVLDRLPTLLPPAISALWLDNTLQYEFPAQVLAAFPQLVSISLSGNYIPVINSSVDLRSVDYFYVQGNNMTRFDASLPNASHLYLSYNHLTEVPLATQIPAARTLTMNHNRVRELNSSHSSDQLKYLELVNNSISKFTAEFPSLEQLLLDNNSLTELPESVFNSPNLRILTLTGNTLTLNLTASQLEFLQKIEFFNLTQADVVEPAAGCNVQLLNDIKVCLASDAASSSGSDGSDESSGSNTAATIGGVAGGVVFLALVAVLVWCHRRRSKRRDTTTTASDGVSGPTNSGAFVTLWSDAQLVTLQVPVDSIEDIKVLGSGAYGVVWLVKYQGSRLLASKRLRPEQVTRQHTQEFVNEIKLMAKFDHPNMVALVGVAWTHEADLQALSEFVDNGDLRDYLLKPTTPREWSSEKLQIAIGVIEALAYVHSFLPPVIHRDLKSRNVLLTSALEAKLTDFGVSRYQSENNTMTVGVGTGRWQAPEVLRGSTDYDQRADIYSFGVLLAELDSHELPYEHTVGESGEKLAEVAILHQVAMGELRPTFSSECPQKLKSLAELCLAYNPKDRSLATVVAYKLRELLKNMPSRR